MRMLAAFLLFLVMPSLIASAQDFDASDVITGTLGRFDQPDPAGSALKVAYPGLFHGWDFNNDHPTAIVDISSIYPSNGKALVVPQPSSSSYVQFGPLAGGTFLFELLFSSAFPSENQTYGICEVRVYDANSTQVGVMQAFQVGKPNHPTMPSTLLCIVNQSVPVGGYVDVRGQTGAFYLDNLSAGGGPTPGEFTSFSARYVREQVELKWQTATELNNYGFAIERSEDGKVWTEVDFVPGAGNSFSPRSYSWTDQLDDKLRRNSKLAYRLLQMDRDGSTEYSNIVYVTLGPAPANVELHDAYPNPFNPATTVSFTLPEAMPVTVRVQNLLGQDIVTLLQNAAVDAGVHTVSFNGDRLPSGSYVLLLQAGNVVRHQRIVLTK